MNRENLVFFGEFCLDGKNACVWCASQPLSLTPKAFQVLQYLVEHAGRLVKKQELLATVWAGTCVSDDVLKVNIRAIRQALQDNPTTPRFIQTIHRRGYRFIPVYKNSGTAQITTSQSGQALVRDEQVRQGQDEGTSNRLLPLSNKRTEEGAGFCSGEMVFTHTV